MTPTSSIRPGRLVAVLDTNSIHPGDEASDPFSLCTDKLTSLAATLPFKLDLSISVITADERKYQLVQKAKKLKAKVEAGCRFFGAEAPSFPINLEEFVSGQFENRCEQSGVSVIGLSHSSVAWDKMITASLSRQPPFSLDGEKGFRDALVIQTIAQFVENLPSDPRDCQIVIVSQDKLFAQAIETRFSSSRNVYWIETRERLAEWVQALSAGLSADQLEQLLDCADLLFVNETWTDGLWIREGIEERITNQFSQDLRFKLPDAISTRRAEVMLSAPFFDGRQGADLMFITIAEFQYDFVIAQDISGISKTELGKILVGDKIGRGAITFEIRWSARQVRDGTLSNPELQGIKGGYRKTFAADYQFEEIPQLLPLVHPGVRQRITSRRKSDRRPIKPSWMEKKSGQA